MKFNERKLSSTTKCTHGSQGKEKNRKQGGQVEIDILI
jgi:hypothetical protein